MLSLFALQVPDLSTGETTESSGSILIQIAVILVLILINAFFAMSEISIVTLNDNKIKKLAKEGHKKAQKVANLTKNSSNFLATIQVGITLSGFLTSASASSSFADNIARWLSFLPVSQHTIEVISVIIITLILSYFSLVLGELVPKKIAMQNAEQVSFKIINVLKGIQTVFKPFIKFLSSSTNFVLRVLGFDPHKMDDTITEEEILMMVDVGKEKGVFEESTKSMIKNVFEFDDKNINEIMTHRTNIFAIEDTESIKDAVDISLTYGCSRIPVFHEDIDNIVGIVYVKDLLKYMIGKNNPSSIKVTDTMRPAIYVPKTKRCSELFGEMISSKTQIAIIVDEYGGTEGLVTIEDLVESIVGEIQDEYDNENEDIQKTSEGTFKIEGNTPLEEISELLKVNFPKGDYDTLAGLVVEHLGKIPLPDEHSSVEIQGYKFTVDDVQDRRISKVTVSKINNIT